MISLKVSHWLSKFWYDSPFDHHQIGVTPYFTGKKIVASMMLGYSISKARTSTMELLQETLKFPEIGRVEIFSPGFGHFFLGSGGVSCSGSPKKNPSFELPYGNRFKPTFP